MVLHFLAVLANLCMSYELTSPVCKSEVLRTCSFINGLLDLSMKVLNIILILCPTNLLVNVLEQFSTLPIPEATSILYCRLAYRKFRFAVAEV